MSGLSMAGQCDILGVMQPPELKSLQQGDGAAWDLAFSWLWPAAFGAAQITLQTHLPAEAEDVAVEALEELVEKVGGVKSVEELRPLAAGIAHHRAVSRLRRHFAVKRGSGKTESLNGGGGEADCVPQETELDSPLASLEQKELAGALREVLAKLKSPQGDIVADFFLHGLSYDEIAQKHQLALGTVGVYLKRGLDAMRRIWERKQKKLQEGTPILR
jgi:RNA polymerase sigma factor (sigma-70 family)